MEFQQLSSEKRMLKRITEELFSKTPGKGRAVGRGDDGKVSGECETGVYWSGGELWTRNLCMSENRSGRAEVRVRLSTVGLPGRVELCTEHTWYVLGFAK